MKQKLRNKGAISLEYILVIVVVVLVSLTAMKLFGGRVGDTVNNSKDAVVNTTNNVFNQLEGSDGSVGSGGSALVNVGPIYEMRPVMGLHTEDQKTQMINSGHFTESNFEAFTGTAYKYEFSFDFVNQEGIDTHITRTTYELSDRGTLKGVLFRVVDTNSTMILTGADGQYVSDSGKKFGELSTSEIVTMQGGKTWEVLSILTDDPSVENPTGMYIGYGNTSNQVLVDEATKINQITNQGMSEYNFKLFTGDVYRYTRGYFSSPRLYFVDLEDHRLLSLTTQGPAVGEVYNGSTVIDAGWEDGELVLHE